MNLIASVLVIGVGISQITCKTRSEQSGLQEGAEELPEENLNNLVLQFGYSAKFTSVGMTSWTKFIITLPGEEVYFMNANDQKFHYEFALKHVPAFANVQPAAFDKATLFNSGRKAISGGVLKLDGRVALDLVSSDALDHQFAVKMLKRVKSRIYSDSPLEIVYLPTFNQAEEAKKNAALYLQSGFNVIDLVQATPETQAYASGWALGRVVEVAHQNIEKAYNSGQLKPADILLTDGIPKEIPAVAGVISTYPATPNSHVAILSRSFQIPFAFTRNEIVLQDLRKSIGKDVLLEAHASGLLSNLTVRPLVLNETDRRAILKMKEPKKLVFPIKKSFRSVSQGKIFKKAGDMVRTDAEFFGGKAVNMKVLKLGAASSFPAEAIGISFDVWDDFLSKAKVGNQSVRQFIAQSLGSYKYPPADIVTMKGSLAAVRDAIKKAAFPTDLKNEIVTTLNSNKFSRTKKIRFRSSTNLEDGENFSGAGLYDSYSGCLGDEDSQSNTTACADDASTTASGEENELRPVTKAIKKVFASFFNDNAFVERLRRNIPAEQVGMAMAVHYSFPDEKELANGVITTEPEEQSLSQIYVVSQVGADSVTNPEVGNLPEEVNLYLSKEGSNVSVSVSVMKYSQKVQTGKLVMENQTHYEELGKIVNKLEDAFVRFHGLKSKPQLDLEYKLVNENGKPTLKVKQIRMIPNSDNKIDRYYVLGRKIPMCLVQSGSFGGGWEQIMSNHYLKGKGDVTVRSGWLDDLVKSKNILSAGQINFERSGRTYRVDLNRAKVTKSEIVSQPYGALRYEAKTSAKVANNNYGLDFGVDLYLSPDLPIVFSGAPSAVMGSGALMVAAKAQTDIADFNGTAKLLDGNFIACDENPPRADTKTQTIIDGDVSVKAVYRFSRESIFKQEENLASWESMEISGITKTPFRITNDSARTYAAGHHNFHEVFFIEPSLDPAVSPAVLAELKQKNIRAIFAEAGFETFAVRAIGFDNQVRALGKQKGMIQIPLPGGETQVEDGGGDLGLSIGFPGIAPETLPQGMIGF